MEGLAFPLRCGATSSEARERFGVAAELHVTS
jgi:hypothetical protein